MHRSQLCKTCSRDECKIYSCLHGRAFSSFSSSSPLLTADQGLHFVVFLQFNVPSQPVVFTKPVDSIAGPFDDISIHPEAQSQLDYEGELCFVFSKDCKNVSEADALDYVLGYTVGNDISARNYIPQEISGFQMSYGKSFDDFAPLGPYLVHPKIVGDPHNLQLTTKVNGDIRQNESTSDMIWKISQIIPHLARGRMVRAGTVCMTGTPSGVGWFMTPTGYVKDGDEMEIIIERLGSIKNKVRFM